jgi:hypothetical protein
MTLLVGSGKIAAALRLLMAVALEIDALYSCLRGRPLTPRLTGLEDVTFAVRGSLSVSHSCEGRRPYTFLFEVHPGIVATANPGKLASIGDHFFGHRSLTFHELHPIFRSQHHRDNLPSRKCASHADAKQNKAPWNLELPSEHALSKWCLYEQLRVSFRYDQGRGNVSLQVSRSKVRDACLEILTVTQECVRSPDRFSGIAFGPVLAASIAPFNCGLLCGGGWGVDCGGPPFATPRSNLPLGRAMTGVPVMALTFAGNGIGSGAWGQQTKRKKQKTCASGPKTDPKLPGPKARAPFFWSARTRRAKPGPKPIPDARSGDRKQHCVTYFVLRNSAYGL